MLKIAICDDIAQDIILIKNKTENILNKLGIKYSIMTADNKNDMLLMLSSNSINVLLLDINMPEVNGFEIARRFNEKIKFIMFVSGEDLLVFESIKYAPFRFIRKNHLEELEEAFYKIKEYYSGGAYYIDIRTTDSGYVSVRFDNIVYIESNNDKLLIYEDDRIYEVRDTLKNIQLRLNKNFVRVHRGFIINLEKIYQIKRFVVELTKGNKIIEVPLKRNIYIELKEKFVEVMRR